MGVTEKARIVIPVLSITTRVFAAGMEKEY